MRGCIVIAKHDTCYLVTSYGPCRISGSRVEGKDRSQWADKRIIIIAAVSCCRVAGLLEYVVAMGIIILLGRVVICNT
jgi:hypothetical protein